MRTDIYEEAMPFNLAVFAKGYLLVEDSTAQETTRAERVSHQFNTTQAPV